MRNKFITITSLFMMIAGTSFSADSDLARQFDGIQLAKGPKSLSNHNPAYITRYGADPFAMIYNDEVFIYMTNDQQEYDSHPNSTNSYANINTINCMSSKDMVNWTDHGVMNVAKSSASWAKNSWAPSACHKVVGGKEKFFLYFADNGGGIGVVTSDNPWGPWSDPRGSALANRSTQNCGNVEWIFDPAVLIDDDGTGYIYFGGGVPKGKESNPGTARVAKLKNNMVELDGAPATINPPYLFEDSGINKIAGKYIYSYCSNWNCTGNPMTNAQICYMTSDNPMGPFSYTGVAYLNQDDFLSGNHGGNNHHAMFEFKGVWYMTYHARMLQNAQGASGDYRSTNIDYVNVNTSNGTISKSKGSEAGVKQIQYHNPFEKTEAETFCWMGGIETKKGSSDVSNMLVSSIDKGDWVGLAGVDFGTGASVFTAKVSSTKGAAIKICKNKADGEVIGYLEVPNTGGQLKEVSARLSSPIAGVCDLFFVFSGSFDFDYWMFKKADVSIEVSETSVEAPATITLTATTSESAINKANFYLGDELIGTSDNAPYTAEYTIPEPGTYSFRAILFDNSGKEYETAEVSVKARIAQGPYEGVAQTLPGTIEMERYDVGGAGYAYNDADDANQGNEFRPDEGVDLDVNGNGGYVLGWTQKGEWFEYTVEVKYDDTYTWEALVASGVESSAFTLYLDDKVISDGSISVPKTGSDWSTYEAISGKTTKLSKGKHILKVGIDADYVNIDYIKFEASNPSGIQNIANNELIEYDIFSTGGAWLGSIKSHGDLSNDLKNTNYPTGAYLVKSKKDENARLIIVK